MVLLPVSHTPVVLPVPHILVMLPVPYTLAGTAAGTTHPFHTPAPPCLPTSAAILQGVEEAIKEVIVERGLSDYANTSDFDILLSDYFDMIAGEWVHVVWGTLVGGGGYMRGGGGWW